MDPSSQNTDNSQGGPETARNPYARGNSFDRPGTGPKVQTAETIKAIQPEQPTAGPVFSAPDATPQPVASQAPVTPASLPPQHTVASGTGDIILEPEAPKKSKKPLIFAIIAAILLIGAFVTYFVVTSGTGQQVAVQADTKTAFNRYANYLLYGEDSDAPLEGEYDEDTAASYLYAIVNNPNKEDMLRYSKDLKQYWQNFYDETSDFIFGNDNQNLSDYQKRVLFITEYINVHSELDISTIQNKMAIMDKDSLLNFIYSRYANIEKLNFEESQKFVSQNKQYWDYLIDKIYLVKDAGCANDLFDNAISECVSSAIGNIDEFLNSAQGYNEQKNETIYQVNAYLVRNCYLINKVIEP